MPIVPLLGLRVNQANEAPDHPELSIRDTETALNVPVTGLSGWDDSYLQAQVLVYGPLMFELVGEVVGADTYTEIIWAERKRKILVQLLASSLGASIGCRLGLEDKNGAWWYTSKETVVASVIQRGSLYIVDLLEFETFGAKKAKLYIESISAGTVDVYMGSV